MTEILPPPSADSVPSFDRYLRAAARRRRRRLDSGSRYEVVVAILWFGPGIAFGAWQGLTATAPTRPPVNGPAALTLLLAGGAVIGLLSSMFGPITASRERRLWLLSTPLDRGRLLRRHGLGVLLLAAAPGIVWGAIVADAAGFRRWDALAAVIAGATLGISAGAAAMHRQRFVTPKSPVRSWIGAVLWLLVLSALLNLIGAIPVAPGALWATVMVATLLMLLTAGTAVARIGQMPLTAVAFGAGSVSSLQLAVQLVSLEPLAWVFASQARHHQSAAGPRPLTGVGQRALFAVDRRRTLRDRAALIRAGVLILVPYAAVPLTRDISWGAAALAIMTLIAGAVAVSGLCTTLRQLAAVPMLADRYGLDRGRSRRTASLVPACGAALWAVLTAPAMIWGGLPVMAVVLPIAALALVRYRAGLTPYEPNFEMGQNYPLDLVRRLCRGPVQLIATAALLGVIAAVPR